jgi:hypothetical protein
MEKLDQTKTPVTRKREIKTYPDVDCLNFLSFLSRQGRPLAALLRL